MPQDNSLPTGTVNQSKKIESVNGTSTPNPRGIAEQIARSAGKSLDTNAQPPREMPFNGKGIEK